MSFFSDFKKFAMRGNVVDMAVGIIIGAAFGKIVSSLVADVIMPPVGLLIGGVDFSNLVITLKAAADGAPAVTINYGVFIQTILDFVIVAFAIFALVKVVSRLQKAVENKSEATATPAPPTKDQELLAEIRDLLKSERVKEK